MEVQRLKRQVHSGKRGGRTVYYEGGRAKTDSLRPQVFQRLFGDLRQSVAFPPRDTPRESSETQVVEAKKAAEKQEPHSAQPEDSATPALSPSPLSQAESPATASPYPELIIKTPPEFFIAPRSVPASVSRSSTCQTFAVQLTSELQSLRLELSPVRPEVPDRIPARKVYQRLMSRTKPQSSLGCRMRRATDPIITPHYAQLSPVLNTVSYKAGCCIDAWERRAHAGV